MSPCGHPPQPPSTRAPQSRPQQSYGLATCLLHSHSRCTVCPGAIQQCYGLATCLLHSHSRWTVCPGAIPSPSSHARALPTRCFVHFHHGWRDDCCSGVLDGPTHRIPIALHDDPVDTPSSSTLMGLLFFFRRRQFRANPRLIRDLLAYNVVFGCQISMIIVYPLYNHLFTQLTSSQQTAFVFILPLLKILYKIWINRALRDTDDAKPEAIIFNVEVFHALFVAYCMQGATSKRTVAALMLIDAAQVWIAFLDIRSILAKVQPIAQKLDQATSSKALHNLLQLTASLTLAEPELLNYATARRLTRPANSATIEPGRMFDDSMRSKPIFGVCVAPQPIAQDPPSDPDRLEPIAPQTKTMSHRFTVLSRVERGVFVHQTLQLFYLTEFLVLIEYTEVIMPLIYSIYVTVISQLRNRTYYQFLQGLTSDQLGPTLANVSLYTSLEFLSLVLMALGLWWSLRFSLLHQLAFVLKTRQPTSKPNWCSGCSTSCRTPSHSTDGYTWLGADYTFQFAWLRQKPTA